MEQVISYTIFIIFFRFFDKNNTFFIKKFKIYQNDFFLGFCIINEKIDLRLANKTFVKGLPGLEPVSIVPRNWIRIEVKSPNKIITKYYPKSILKVKPTPLFKLKDFLLYLFLLFFLLLLFFLFLNWLKKSKSPDLQEKLQNEPDFILKNKMKSQNKLKIKLKLRLKISAKIKNYFDTLLKVGTLVLREALVSNEYVYNDKINDHERDNSIFLVCRHFFIDIKIHYFIIVTKDLPEFGLYSGMKGSVKKVLVHQKIEVQFFYDSTLFAPWAKQKLLSFESFLIKEYDFYKN